MNRLAATLALASTGTAALPVILWDNNVIPNGVNGRGVSPPAFPSVRIVDDIVVRAPGWRVDTIRAFLIEDIGWQDGGSIDVYVYNDDGGSPGPIFGYWAGLTFTKSPGPSYFGRPGYTYSINLFRMDLEPGRYWLGMRNSLGSGSGTNSWLFSDGGPDGGDSSTGYASGDGGHTWRRAGSDSHFAFMIEGVPEPTTLIGLGAAVAAVAARRRRRNDSGKTIREVEG